MANQIASRPKSFTGCWTCKARKVKCDEQPIACRNCVKRGIVCAGYGLQLLWVSDALASDSTAKMQGRMALRLDQSCRRYETRTIDRFLSTLDKEAKCGLTITKGPFSTFPADPKVTDPTGTSSKPSSEASDEAMVSEVLGSSDLDNHTRCQSSTAQETTADETEQPVQMGFESHLDIPFRWSPDSIDLLSPLPQGSGDSPNAMNTIINISSNEKPHEQLDEQSFELLIEESFENFHQNPYEQLVASHGAVENSHQPPPYSGMTLNLSQSEITLTPHIQITIFGDPEVDFLMSHYHNHVADILQPLDHFKNPFRHLYLSMAIEGMWHWKSEIQATQTKAYSAIFHSLLASSAYQLWSYDKTRIKYQEIGARSRYRAIQSLRAAIEETAPEANYKAIMTAMLSLVTIGVVSGEGDDFSVHIEAATQLRNKRGRWKLLSDQSRELNAIGAFLALLTRTLSFQASPLPWPGFTEICSEEMSIKTSSCYEYSYGLTSTIATAIYQTCRLAEYLARFSDEQDGPIPNDFCEACEELGERLQAWRFESETVASNAPVDDLMFSILALQAKAWHGAAFIYYSYRIQGTRAADLVQEVETIAEYLHASEDIKAKSGTARQKSMAPITWPSFVASCIAISSRRDTWRKWWERIEHYGIANISKQWSVIQRIWEKIDQGEQEGENPTDWTEAYTSLGIKVLPT